MINKQSLKKSSSSSKVGLLGGGPSQPFSKNRNIRPSSIGRLNRPLKKSSSKTQNSLFLTNSDNFCLQLLKEYPFNAFFFNFVCYIRDSLFSYFEFAELKREGNNNVDEKEYKVIKDGFLDFEAQMEPKISILKDICNTKNEDFNSFMRNIILR